MNEMKAYIGADEMIELVQKSRGFKSYRELYTKKIAEAENAAKILKMEQKEVKVNSFLLIDMRSNQIFILLFTDETRTEYASDCNGGAPSIASSLCILPRLD